MTKLKNISVLVVLLCLSACASLSPNFEQPQVNVTSFSLAPSALGTTPTFVIGLQVINPNRRAISLQGMSYSVEVEQHRVLSGAEANLPEVPGYGMAEFSIKASPDLLGSARLINQLLTSQQNQLQYLFKAKLDVGALLPFVTIEEAGELDLMAR